MPAETAAAAALSIIASILSITRSVKELMQKNQTSKEDALALFRKGATKAQKDVLDRPGMSAAVLQMMVISPTLLQQLDDEAKACEDRHVQGRKEAGGDEAKLDKVGVDAAKCMCEVLRSIKRFNRDQLPRGDLQDWWDSYRC